MKKLALGFLAFILSTAATLALIWFNLEFVLNERNVTYARDRFSAPVSWKALEIEVRNLGVKEKHLLIDAKDLCFNWESPQIQACFAYIKFEAKARVLFGTPFIKVRDLTLNAESSVANIFLVPDLSKQPAPQKSPLWPSLGVPPLRDLLDPYLKWIDRATIQKIYIDVKNTQIQNEDLVINASALLDYENSVLSLKNQTRIHRQTTHYLTADLEASLDLNTVILNAKINADVPFIKTNTLTNISWDKFLNIESDIKSSYLLPTDNKIILSATERFWKLNLDADANLKKWNMGRTKISGCYLDLQLDQAGHAKSLYFPCNIDLFNAQKLTNRHLPSTVSIKFENKNALSLKGESLNILSTVNVGSLENTLVSMYVKGESEVAVNLKSFALEKVSIPDLLIELKVEKVLSWHEVFKKNNVPLPAPLNVLDGPIQLTTKVNSPDLNMINTKCELITQLEGQKQKLITSSKAQLDVDLKKFTIKLNGEALLREIAVDLPYIGLEAPPQFMPDKRFQKEPKTTSAKPNKWKFEIEKFTVKTPEKPIIVRTRLINESIPIRVDYTLTGKKMYGTVGLDPFAIELFKKKFRINKMKVIKPLNSEIMDLDGELNYSNSEVKVSILVIGTTSSPKIEFLSDPPLSREQIISVVLFNKSLQQLTDEDRALAGQMNQALLSDAFGIFSLVFLSSTPIESLYYDPISKSYTARVKIDDQTSLSLGSNFDTSQQFQLRRRLGGPWSVVTELQKSQNADDIITTLLEWFKRF